MNKIKIIVLTLLAFPLWGQVHHGKKFNERFHAKKIAFITSHLDLTPQEAEKFWPVYNQYEKQRMSLAEQRNPIVEKRVDEWSDNDADAYIQGMLLVEEKTLQLKKDFIRQLRGILPAQKVAKLVFVERRFRERILRQLKKRING